MITGKILCYAGLHYWTNTKLIIANYIMKLRRNFTKNKDAETEFLNRQFENQNRTITVVITCRREDAPYIKDYLAPFV